MFGNFGARKCFFCGVYTLRRKKKRFVLSFLLTKDYLAHRPNITLYSRHKFEDQRQITEDQDRICELCLKRADQYVMAINKAQEEPTTLRSQDEVPGPSTSSRALLKPQDEDDEDIPHKQNKTVKKPKKLLKENEQVIQLPGYTHMPINTTNCIMADCDHTQNLKEISFLTRAKVVFKQNIFIPQENQVCEEHLKDEAKWKDLKTHSRPRKDKFNSLEVTAMLNLLRDRARLIYKYGPLDSKSISYGNEQ